MNCLKTIMAFLLVFQSLCLFGQIETEPKEIQMNKGKLYQNGEELSFQEIRTIMLNLKSPAVKEALGKSEKNHKTSDVLDYLGLLATGYAVGSFAFTGNFEPILFVPGGSLLSVSLYFKDKSERRQRKAVRLYNEQLR